MRSFAAPAASGLGVALVFATVAWAAPPPNVFGGNVWSQSSVLVLRSNDALAPFSSSVYVYLDEVSPSTGSITTSFGPIVGTGPNARFATLSTQYPRDAWAQVSENGKLLTFMAMDVPANSGWPDTAVNNAKVVVSVGANGSVSTTTNSVPMYEAGNYYLFTAATSDGTGYWVAGPSSTGCDNFAGVRYLPPDASGTNVLLTPNIGRCHYDTRYVSIARGNVYAAFSDPGVRGIYLVGGGGLTTTPDASPLLLSGFENYQGPGDLGAVQGNTFSTIAGFVFQNVT